VLDAGPPAQADPPRRRLPAWAGRAAWWGAAGVVGLLALGSLGPVRWGGPDTGLTLVVTDGLAYYAVGVDDGSVEQLPQVADLESVVGAVAWLPGDPDLQGRASGGFPPWNGGRETVARVGDRVLTLVGAQRIRRLQLWDHGYTRMVEDLGPATAVKGVSGDEALVTGSCLILGCPTDLVDLSDGSRTPLRAPPGFQVVDSALGPDGQVALGVVEDDGKFAASGQFGVVVGRPGSWQVLPGLAGLPWDRLEWAPDGLLLVTLADGDVVLWQSGADPVRVVLPEGSRVRAVSGSR
jgi:hypothetical protein